MPLPLSFALFAMEKTRTYHNAPTFQRPAILGKVYVGRVMIYGVCAMMCYHADAWTFRGQPAIYPTGRD